MAITYDAPNDTITVIGGTEETPLTWEDIYQADVSGGWGQVSKQGDIEYLIEANVRIGGSGSTTWFADTDKAVQIGTSSAAKWLAIGLSHNEDTHFRLGEDTTPPRRGGYLRIYFPYGSNYHWSGEVEFYGTNLRIIDGRQLYLAWYQGSEFIIKYSDLEKDYHFLSLYRTQTWERTNFHDSGGAYHYTSSITYDDVRFEDNAYGFLMYGAISVTATNTYLRDNTYVAFLNDNWTGNLYLVNADVDSWVFYWDTPAPTGKVYRQYEFDVHCQDKEGNDLSGVSVVAEYISPYGQAFSTTTDGNGDISTQTVDHGFFDQPNGNTEQLKTPLKVTYSKAGYQTIVKYYDLEEKTKDAVVLHKAVGVFISLGMPVVNLKKTDLENKNVLVL